MAIVKPTQRTCISCRQVKDKKQLIRYVVAPDGAILVDYRQRLPGRGAYTCPSLECLQDAVKTNAFQRSYKGKCNSISFAELQRLLQIAIDQKIIGLIGMARKSGQITAGTNAVIEKMRKSNSLALIILAEDISASIGSKIEALIQKNKIYGVRLYTKQAIGQLLGKEERSAIAIPAGKLADSMLVELHQRRQLVREN